MFTIAVVNQKGGSGKSTLAQCLAVAAYLDDKGVAILDIDPQGSAYKWAQRRKEKDPNPVVKSVTPANHEDEWQSMKNAEADLVIFDTPARLSDHERANRTGRSGHNTYQDHDERPGKGKGDL